MKTIKSYIAIVIGLTMVFTSVAVAQAMGMKTMPNTIAASFNNKYPNATIKSWEASKDKYVVKALVSNQKCIVTFEKNGNWETTFSRVKWSWNLPAPVKNALKKSKYAAWKIYSIAKVENSTGEYYRVIVDDANLQPDSDHALMFTTDQLLEFKPDGTIARNINITDDLYSYYSGSK